MTGFGAVGPITESTAADADPIPTLAPIGDSLLGKAYRVYRRTGTMPEMPSDVTSVELEGMPNLEDFFNVKGGTIDLLVTGTPKDSRRIIINEVMWAVDNSQVGQPGHIIQQWIEIYNRTSIPVALDTISLTFIDDTFPPPATKVGTSDRLSNIAGRQNIWTVKGSSGTSTSGEGADDGIIGADPVFVSMSRSKQGDPGWNSGSWEASNRPYSPGFLGTPGSVNKRAGLPTARANPGAFTPPKDKLIINEVYNDDDDDLDWIELRNVSDDDVNLEKWRLSYTTNTGTANGDEKLIIRFPKWVVEDSGVEEDES